MGVIIEIDVKLEKLKNEVLRKIGRNVLLFQQVETGHLPIDNNPVENSIRPIALGKNNGLFVGFERAGKRAAAIQPLPATAKLNDLNPAQWLTETLEKRPTWPNSRIDELLLFAPEHIEARKQNQPERPIW